MPKNQKDVDDFVDSTLSRYKGKKITIGSYIFGNRPDVVSGKLSGFGRLDDNYVSVELDNAGIPFKEIAYIKDPDGKMIYKNAGAVRHKTAYEVDKDRVEKRIGEIDGERRGLVHKFLSVVNLMIISLGVYLLTPSFTGNAVSDLSVKTSSLFGVWFLIVGLVVAYLLFRD